jgi:hypothetical protein
VTITSSETVSVSVQADGRRYVLEYHTDHLGVVHPRTWLAGAADNLAAALAAYATNLVEALRQREIEANIASVMFNGSTATTTFAHSTIAENRTALRAAYLTATRVEAIMIGDFLSSQTNATLQTLFGTTNTQVNTLRTNKLTPAANAAATIRAATGA